MAVDAAFQVGVLLLEDVEVVRLLLVQGGSGDHHFPDAVVVGGHVGQSLQARCEFSLGLDVIRFDGVDPPANEQGRSAPEASRAQVVARIPFHQGVQG